MFSKTLFLSLAFPFLVPNVLGLDLDAQNTDSIQSAAQTLASSIVSAYNASQVPGAGPGLFSESGEPYYWWTSGVAWNALISYTHLTNDTQYTTLITNALVHQSAFDGTNAAFQPVNQSRTLGNDDQAFWGLVALTAAEIGFPEPLAENITWLELATSVFDVLSLRWDGETCGGGLRWQIYSFNNGYNYKNSFSNGNYFRLAARLAILTGNTTFADSAERTFTWAKDVGLVGSGFEVFDGADTTKNCSNFNEVQWTLTSAMFIEGAAAMYNFTNGTNTVWRDAATNLLNASSVFLQDNILTEIACETNGKCDTDHRSYKGLAAASFYRAAALAPAVFAPSNSGPLMETWAEAAAGECSGNAGDLTCGFKWSGENDDTSSVSEGGLGEVVSALEVVQGLLVREKGVFGGNGGGGTPVRNGRPAGSGTPTGSAAPTSTSGEGGAEKMAAGGLMGLVGLVAVLVL